MGRWYLNTILNVIGAAICVLLIIFIIVLPQEKVLLGVIFRGLLSLLLIYNSLYLIFTDKPSFITRKEPEKNRRIGGVILLVVGLFAFITVLMGYGLNGYPPIDWRTVFPQK